MNRYTSHVYTRYEDLDHNMLLANIEAAKNDKINYPKMHIAPKSGLLNDPNGLAYYNGLYHIFYQVCPNGPFHGMKSWNLVTTKDFINYKDHGVILTVTEEYENFGIFSGGAYIINGELCLLYTGNYRDPQADYKRMAYQVIATLDKDYNVVSKRVIRKPDENLHTEHFRDPVGLDNQTILIGMQDPNLQGQLGLIKYSKPNFQGESQLSIIKNNWNLDSFMFECPNLFTVSNKSVLLFSPQGVKATDKYSYNNIHDVVYSVADNFNSKHNAWAGNDLKLVDHGFDFYAPQVFNDGKRTLMLAWLGVPDTIYPGDEENKWSQMLTTIRELSIKDNQLYQKPVEEYKQLEGDWQSVNKQINLQSKVFKVKLSAIEDFSLMIGNDDHYLKLSKVADEIILDRSNCQYQVNEKYGTKRYLKIEEQEVNIEIIVDMSSIEIFINDGKYALTSRFFIDQIEQLSVESVKTCDISYLNNIIIN